MNMRQNEAIKTNLCVLLAVLVVAAAGLTAALVMDTGSVPEQAQTQPAKQQTVPRTDTTQAVDAAVPPKQADTTTYALRTRDGCLQVYILETDEFYMETSIVYRLLPESVQAQIDRGKYFESEEELFEFLENYSS